MEEVNAGVSILPKQLQIIHAGDAKALELLPLHLLLVLAGVGLGKIDFLFWRISGFEAFAVLVVEWADVIPGAAQRGQATRFQARQDGRFTTVLLDVNELGRARYERSAQQEPRHGDNISHARPQAVFSRADRCSTPAVGLLLDAQQLM